METDILIIGGGLSGLSLAAQLDASGRDWRLVEATGRLGGRIRSPRIAGGHFDLGPTWFWPGQPRMAALAQRHGLRMFEQFSEGAMVFQDRAGRVEANRGFASMEGSLRLEGGMEALILGLEQGLPGGRFRIGTPVTTLRRGRDTIAATLGDETIAAHHVVLAVPPRIVAETVEFDPPLPDRAMTAARAMPTWMAGQAKILAVYDRPHWRERGFSGDAISQRGPLVEIHDASPASGGPYALFGFVGVPPEIRAAHENEVVALARDQLAALFGPALSRPLEITMMDWAKEPRVATTRDLAGPMAHPEYGLPAALREVWDGALSFASSETAPEFGGYLEGALAASAAAALRFGIAPNDDRIDPGLDPAGHRVG